MTHNPTSETLDIVKRLGGQWHGHYALCRCPAHNDRKPSLSIKQGRRSILVHCFAGCSGQAVMSSIRRVLGRSVEDQNPTVAPHRLPNTSFRQIWEQAGPISGTLAERYLKEIRGITFIPKDVRFHPRCPKGKGRDVQYLPALIVGVFRLGQLCAIQRQFLDPTTAERTARMMLGNSRGGIWPSYHPGTKLHLAEGFETACAFQQIKALPGATCFGERNFSIVTPPSHIKGITLLPDNQAQAISLANTAIAERSTEDVPIDMLPCPDGFNDWADIIAPKRP
ncbi:hypothetical protein B2G71_19555 [Novosphingobium sp. PC22D]|uniref:DUF7146 domain-containing protein n=2 Tax=Novosphingobium TaxID=165696 RepID=A0ABQ2JUZ7_9SPHN|nr:MULTISPECIES: hypothetical protein [Novosphingobium]MCJ2180079.1 hypothetical protein [Novosphingobium album (ex Hu et al. 2023)]PEQ11010.1 hypothetical protein B2G71_19555 [Novosphingobium sp. PC22D]GGN55506.1 hypothetical protein GCM10011349_32200 [Novosphingobium indicum]